jgi:hypothetical protein
MMPTDDNGSVTLWLGALKDGDLAAAQPLWERYFAQLVRLARARLRARPRAGADTDDEDAALSAFDSFCAGAARGRFPQLADRDELWRLLVTLTARKVRAQIQRQRRQKRGGGHVLHEADLLGADADGGDAGPEQVASRRLLLTIPKRSPSTLPTPSSTTTEVGAIHRTGNQ